jgi:hypothetical protein
VAALCAPEDFRTNHTRAAREELQLQSWSQSTRHKSNTTGCSHIKFTIFTDKAGFSTSEAATSIC